IEQGDGQRPVIMDKVRWARRVVDETFPRHLASGIRYACGTDSMHGLMPVELETLVRFGVPPRDALLAGTRWGAEACRIDDQVGTLVPGQARRSDRDRRRPLEGHSGDAPGQPGHERWSALRRSLREEPTMSESITRREWLHRTGGLAVGAGVGSLRRHRSVGRGAAQGRAKRGGRARGPAVRKTPK